MVKNFNSSDLSAAFNALWDICHIDLEMLGLNNSSHKSSGKCHLIDVIITDIMGACEKLYLEPSILCETTDLWTLPSMELDPGLSG